MATLADELFAQACAHEAAGNRAAATLLNNAHAEIERLTEELAGGGKPGGSRVTCGECWMYACYDDGEGCHLTGKTCKEGDECSATPAKLAEAIAFLAGLMMLREGQVRCATCEMGDRTDAPRRQGGVTHPYIP